MQMGMKSLHCIMGHIFKLMSERFDMSLFPARDTKQKLIRVQDFCVAIQQKFVAVKHSIKLVLEASKKAILESIEKLRIHKKIMRNFLDMCERATFVLKGSSKDKHLKA